MFFSIKEDVFYRQRTANNSNSNLINENELIPNGIIPNQYANNQGYHVNDQYEQTIEIEKPITAVTNDITNYNEHNYNLAYAQQLQQQHFVPHSKLHSLDRFAVPSSIMPPPAPQIRNHHDHLTNDHELSLNETDNEEDQVAAGHRTFNPTNPNLEPQTPNNFPLNAYTDAGGVQLEFSENNEKNAPKKKKGSYEEMSIIDLNELDEAQLKQLQAEEEQQQQEYFNIDHLNRLYCQAQFLYKIRGLELNFFKCYLTLSDL